MYRKCSEQVDRTEAKSRLVSDELQVLKVQ